MTTANNYSNILIGMESHMVSHMDSQIILPGFFVFEGLDGSGTTTQLRLLEQRFERSSLPYRSGWEPTDGPIGTLIRKVLSGEVSTTPESLAYLFVSDRHEHVHGDDGIIDTTQKSISYLCDRYLFSSLAYQSIACGFEFVFELNSVFPLPEILFYIDVPTDVCLGRIAPRPGKEIFEKSDLLKQVETNYSHALDRYTDSGMRIVILDGTQPQEKVHEQIWKTLLELPIHKA